MAELDLAGLQEWLLTTCTSRGRAGGRHDARPVSEVVRGSGRLTGEARVEIYARGYRARLHECLKAEFPVLRALIGDRVFGLFAEGYLMAHPPTSYSLFDLGARFADFLQGTRPDPGEPPGSPDGLPTALARLERARAESRRARGVETDPAHRPLDPLAVLTSPDLTVRVPSSLRLLHLDFALLDTLVTADRGDLPAVPAAADTRYAVARTHYHVRVHVLEPWQHAFLGTCAATGGTALHTAADATARTCARDVSEVWAALVTWLPAAVDAGMATCAAGDREAAPEPAGASRTTSSER